MNHETGFEGGYDHRPHPARLDPTRSDYSLILAAHEGAIAAGEPGYIDPSTGLFVLTAAELYGRGWCCTEGCRHCPFLARRPPEAQQPID
jgi:Family of unknown function (DUF5522)